MLSHLSIRGVRYTVQSIAWREDLLLRKGYFQHTFPLPTSIFKALDTRILAIKPSPYQTVLAGLLGKCTLSSSDVPNMLVSA